MNRFDNSYQDLCDYKNCEKTATWFLQEKQLCDEHHRFYNV